MISIRGEVDEATEQGVEGTISSWGACRDFKKTLIADGRTRGGKVKENHEGDEEEKNKDAIQ